MKKIIAILLTLTISFSTVTNIGALNNDDEKYTYSYNDYETTVVALDEGSGSCFEVIENNQSIKLEFDEYFRYVKVNDDYYKYDDFNAALTLQSSLIFDKNLSVTIVEVLEDFSKINDINDFLINNEVPTEDKELSIQPRGYGDYYFVGSRKKSLLVSLAGSAISTIIAFLITGALGLEVVKSNVIAFISGVLAAEGVNYFTSDVYYKIYQAILNVHNTTREKRILGVFMPFKAKIDWDEDHPYYRTFETQRP